jgi:Lrp/AsnC family transcriptional regulator, leucine-responsive regulatory protein
MYARLLRDFSIYAKLARREAARRGQVIYMQELDRTDLKILAAVQEKGDLTMEELGARVSLSTSQASRRLERLRRDGYIARVAAVLDAERLGLGIKAYIMVGLVPHVQHASAFHELVRRSPEILECCMTTGETDFLLKVQTRDLKTFRELLTALTATKQVAAIRSSIVIEETKNLTALPLSLIAGK